MVIVIMSLFAVSDFNLLLTLKPSSRGFIFLESLVFSNIYLTTEQDNDLL